ncbi:NAD(P)-dependent dehydrogenase (short-subunit alcohol dehydrogenase family) [Variovorax boronicumulans]|uniref:SDR family NAD(P)-dependent oxidoreductase n=1 Tax=Variovorax TaxID=34072 RepID=UPI002783B03D|nr:MULTISPECIES: SDR family oxidoreductase [Variovorax]MDP9990812.1 NAD(P)-dependent dehydrogenase (short-subunit alcohol dehydrogenase family) [Variovorax boronicumulans]MDQ0002840.1 NAD(P)-dependent dehydrogenase (short-subunit alcohol dehydrogenase family) [Variovorax boronicumulans]MDQ0032350.1 NAD(P)-dependent dehydrogenase (short-subunit alcohol dehydrogenase family) [Variovorax boronicumulans]MDQ0609857.1 NAD(P)-dependent dehydrogenase (short-subunit alcohol dehydrogenase family) [Variov
MSDANTTPHVVITGAAGALGRAVAQHFLEQGARLALIDHHAGRLAEVFPGLDNSQHLLLAGDVTSAPDMAELLTGQVLKAFGRVDALVHIAGGFEMGEATHALSRASWDRMMNLNAWSFVAVTQAVLPSMIERKSGRIVAVTAKVAARGAPAMAAYIASKSALQRLVEAMAAEAAPHGVSVNSVAPSVLDTPANRQAMPDANPAEWVSTSVAAQTIGFLASPAAAALHGQHLTLDT